MKVFNYEGWSNLAKVVYKRTYAREIALSDGSVRLEDWPETASRTIRGNLALVDPKFIQPGEEAALIEAFMRRQETTAGRGLWIGGTDFIDKAGGDALNNCWFLTADKWMNFIRTQDLLMQGGGVGASVEHKFVCKLPNIHSDEVSITHSSTNDADFIVPDSRKGWNELIRKVLESYFETGESFTYSTICVRGAGEKIKGFGGTAAGPLPLIKLVNELGLLFTKRRGKHLRPIDAADLICHIAAMVVAGNVRRSALMILGDAWDREFLTIKRWDLKDEEGNTIVVPSCRYQANFSIVANEIDDLTPLFWESYNLGEPIGIFNRKNAQKYGRMGELKNDNCQGVNPCAEITLEEGEPCNLIEMYLSRIINIEEFKRLCRLATRMAIRTTCADYSDATTAAIIAANRRIGIGLTGILDAPLYNTKDLDAAYKVIQEEARSYCKELGIPECVRLTTIKPSGTLGKLGDVLEGCHPAYSRYMIQRVRFGANDELVDKLREAGHKVEMERNQDGTPKRDSMVVEFYIDNGPDAPTADGGFDTWKQLDALLMLQKHWSDNSVSITVYYQKEDIPKMKEWLKNHLQDIKSISFLLHQGHGFVQAPKEAITKEEYEALSKNILPIDVSSLKKSTADVIIDNCDSGHCPIK